MIRGLEIDERRWLAGRAHSEEQALADQDFGPPLCNEFSVGEVLAPEIRERGRVAEEPVVDAVLDDEEIDLSHGPYLVIKVL